MSEQRIGKRHAEPLPITPRAWRPSIFLRAVATAAALNRTR